MNTNRWLRYSFVYLLLLVFVAVLLYQFLQPPHSTAPFVSLNEVVTDARKGLIERIETQGSSGDLLVIYWDDPDVPVRTHLDNNDSIARVLRASGVSPDSIDIVAGQSSADWTNVLTLLGTFLPLVVVCGILYFLLRRAQSGNQVAKNLIQHTWKIEQKVAVTFADAGGMQKAKQSVADIVDYLQDPNRLGDSGARLSRAVLVQGPTGVGKNLFVQAVAGEAGAKLINCSSSEFVEVFAGVGAARIRDVFQQASKLAPVILFIDEIDAIARPRTPIDKEGSPSEYHLLLSQLFTELDQLKTRQGVAVFAATNRPDLIDPAVLRAGRLDRQIRIELPTEDERLEILKILVRGKQVAPDVRLEDIARQTTGRTGADLAAIVNQAEILALKDGPAGKGHALNEHDLEQAMEMFRVTA